MKIKEVSVNIKELRLSTGMTIQEFSDYFNIPRRTIENWEGGQRKPPVYVVELIEYKINKERINMKKYLLITNGYNAVVWSDGEKYFVFDDKDGCYEGIDLYQDTKQVINQLRELEFDNGAFKDLCQTFPDNVHEVDDDFYNNTLIEF